MNLPFVSARLSALPARLLQNIVSEHSAQFRGNAQHDALEFLLWLLDRMHEDLGAVSPAQHPRVPEEVGGPCQGGHTPWLWGDAHAGPGPGEAEMCWEGPGWNCPPYWYGMGMRVMWFGPCGRGEAVGIWVLRGWVGWLGAGRARGCRQELVCLAEHPSSAGHPSSWGCLAGRRSTPRASPPPAKL